MRSLLLYIANILIKYCEKNNKVIRSRGGPNGNTLSEIKYTLFESKIGSIYIHRLLSSDIDDPHDHSFNFATYILSGEYTEYSYDLNKPVFNKRMAEEEKHKALAKRHYISYWTETEEKHKAGSLTFRSARVIHRLELDKLYREEDQDKAPLTICFMGRARRQWGFWPSNDGGSVFVDWRKYLNIKKEK